MKNVYYFGEGKAEGGREMKTLLGGKGSNVSEMSSIGVLVPPGFTISTAVCEAYYANKRRFPKSVKDEVEKHLVRL
ncbi:MAG: PEP/pyruvate-binding domain-containing protein, partial [Spirochaetia bacterium]